MKSRAELPNTWADEDDVTSGPVLMVGVSPDWGI